MTKTSASPCTFSARPSASGKRWRALALAALGAVAFAGEVLAERSADLIKRNKGFALPCSPLIQRWALPHQTTVSLAAFRLAEEGDVLNLSSSVQGVGGG
ncbi:MAG: hypothetical protein ACPG42_11295 [Alphaproteobacteria bacterium]